MYVRMYACMYVGVLVFDVVCLIVVVVRLLACLIDWV